MLELNKRLDHPGAIFDAKGKLERGKIEERSCSLFVHVECAIEL